MRRWEHFFRRRCVSCHFSAEGVVHIIKWELCGGRRQHVQIWLFSELSQMVSSYFRCLDDLMFCSLLCWSLSNCSPTCTLSNWLLAGFAFRPLSGLCVHLAGCHSGIVEWECLQIRSLWASSVPSLLIYASMTRESWTDPVHLVRSSDISLYKYCTSHLLSLFAASGWRGWLKSTSCVSIRSCVQSVLPQCSSERSHGEWTWREYFKRFIQRGWCCLNLCPHAGMMCNHF